MRQDTMMSASQGKMPLNYYWGNSEHLYVDLSDRNVSSENTLAEANTLNLDTANCVACTTVSSLPLLRRLYDLLCLPYLQSTRRI
jgi:hypothetical protein